ITSRAFSKNRAQPVTALRSDTSASARFYTASTAFGHSWLFLWSILSKADVVPVAARDQPDQGSTQADGVPFIKSRM
ncbi:hypothetical protein ABVV53_01740, partial [Novosphingobium sp. RD2P27]